MDPSQQQYLCMLSAPQLNSRIVSYCIVLLPQRVHLSISCRWSEAAQSATRGPCTSTIRSVRRCFWSSATTLDTSSLIKVTESLQGLLGASYDCN